VDDIVQVPPPGLMAPGVLERALVAELARVVSEHRSSPDRSGLRFAAAPVREPVLAEVVAGAVGGSDLPVLVVIIAVGRVGVVAVEALEPGAVVVLQLPGSVGRLDQLAALAVPGDGGVVVGPALVARIDPV